MPASGLSGAATWAAHHTVPSGTGIAMNAPAREKVRLNVPGARSAPPPALMPGTV